MPKPSTQLLRFHWLLGQLNDKGITQADIARRTGLSTSYINRIANFDRVGVMGVSSEAVASVCAGMGIKPDYFFDDYEGERPFETFERKGAKLYVLPRPPDDD